MTDSAPAKVFRGSPARIAWLAVLLAALAWYGSNRVVAPLRFRPFTGPFHGNDFKHIYLGPWMLARGMNPYDPEQLRGVAAARGFQSINPYVYLPFTAIVMRPLAALDPPDAMLAWFLVNHAFLFAALALTLAATGPGLALRRAAAAMALAALCYPVHRTLTAGQLNAALFFLFALVFFLERRGLSIPAGCTAAFAFLFKLIPGILGLYFAWRAWTAPRGSPERRGALRALVAMVVATAALLAGSIAVAGWRRHLDFLPLLARMGYGRSTWAEFGQHFYRDPTNQSFNAFFHHVLTASERLQPWVAWNPAVADNLTRLALALCFAATARVLWPRKGDSKRSTAPAATANPAPAYGAFLLLALLVPSIYWDHYATIALWPMLVVWTRLPEAFQARALALAVVANMALGSFLEIAPLTLGALVVLAIAIVIHMSRPRLRDAVPALLWALAASLLLARFVYDLPPFRSGAGLLAMSIKLWGTLLLLGLALLQAREPAASEPPPHTPQSPPLEANA